MNDILNLKTGLPDERINIVPILEQYLISRTPGSSNGTLIFDDGVIFITTLNQANNDYRWIFFTRLKSEGIDMLKTLIISEFSKTEIAEKQHNSSEKQVLWKSNFQNVKHQVLVGSGSYDSLPPVFRKIDDLINRYMYKMNEKV
ncbi:MAG TPA: hypothetical protein DER09_10735 [Prolixibacteraceae bacterium]|nr:hypothetical protein [Prolixibacteraceae bacterium]